MPSPFPGMDPFLEHPDFFPGLHAALAFCIREQLQARLPDSYFAEISERSLPTDQEDDEVREQFVEIWSKRDGDRLVASVEVPSPANKTPGDHGREKYIQKQRELLDSHVHLIEIDLLRIGRHSTAVPERALRRSVAPFDYHVCVHRADRPDEFSVYPIRLPQRLPTIRVPLLPTDPDVPLDLQSVFDRSYDTGPYRRRLSYHDAHVVPPLTAEQDVWVRNLLPSK
ncbi:MAG: DUF4058 family protein [Planctomycetaceae bacterium]